MVEFMANITDGCSIDVFEPYIISAVVLFLILPVASLHYCILYLFFIHHQCCPTFSHF